jgi:diguanylate cyclase (GGDEF)-like protein
MNDTGKAGPRRGARTGHAILRTLVGLAVLPLPVAAYLLGVYALSRVGGANLAQQLLRDQTLLVLIGLVVAGVGGFLIWTTATSLARTAEIDTPRKRPDDLLPEGTSFSSSITRMLCTIDRQSAEINQVAGELDSVQRELESARARLDEVSFIDEATGLYNERFFVVRLEEEVARHHRFGHPVSLVLIELVGVRRTGDGPGITAGAEVLRAVVETLHKNSRSVDLICRYGADELAVLLVETPRAEAGAYAERTRDIVSSCLWGHGEQVTASLGAASLPDDASSGHDLVRAAAEALDAAKRTGKNCVAVYGESGGEPARTREVGAA